MTNSNPQFVRVICDETNRRQALFTHNGEFFLYSYVNNEMAHETMVFASDENGFVVDFSSLRPLEEKLKEHFDHTFLVNFDDPLLETWQKLHSEDVLDLRVMNNVGMESTAELVWGWANDLLFSREKGRSCCWKATAHENDFNSASYTFLPEWFNP